MVSRKSHSKSRTGCAQCKRRRIKCDERTPTCTNCIKHSITCDFSLQGVPDANLLPPPGTQLRASEIRSPKLLPAKKYGLADLNMMDLELLHHFTTETCFTLSDQPNSHRLWQVVVPQEAFHHDFLMRGILAVASLHLSYLRPEKEEDYRRMAVQHQDVAIGSFRSIMPKITQSNCHAFFALSSLIVIFAFAAPRASNSLAFTNTSQEPAEWLPLIRGVHSILMSVWPWIKHGSLGGLLPDGIDEPNTRDLAEVADNQFVQLSRLCENASDKPEILDAYRATVQGLRACFVKLYSKNPNECEVSIAFLWPIMIPQTFIAMLNSRAPEALVVLAHYCVILHHLDGYWWKKGWADHLMANIYRELDESWHSWIEWPSSLIEIKNSASGIIPPDHENAG